MGMTDDFELAVEEGATIVRVGRALFGERAHDHDHGAPAGAGPIRTDAASDAAREAWQGESHSAGRLGRVAFVLTFVQFLLIAVWLLVLGRMLMSWVDPSARNQVSSFLIQATEPLLSPVRRVLPATGAIDWSGFVVLIVLGFLWRAF